jgi:hypothetical protein
MRYESSITSVSWTPSEALDGTIQLGVDAFGHYDALAELATGHRRENVP